MISARQIRAARSLLGWPQQALADRAIVSPNTIKRIESGVSDPRASTLIAIKEALEKAGIEFIPESSTKGEGVRLARPGHS